MPHVKIHFQKAAQFALFPRAFVTERAELYPYYLVKKKKIAHHPSILNGLLAEQVKLNRPGQMNKEHLEIILENIQSKFELVLEGHEVLRKEIQNTKKELGEEIGLISIKLEALNDKIDRVDQRLTKRIDGLGQKIDAVAADLSAHRADTEAHSNIYKVKEAES